MTQIDILNLALGRISQAQIISLVDGSVQAEVASRVWTPCLQEVYRQNNWNFAQVVALLSLVSSYTAIGWTYAYELPTNQMKVWKLYADPTPCPKKKSDPFRKIYVPSLARNIILSNTLTAYGEYTYYVTDPTLFDETFISVLGYRLAAEMAMPLNADADQAITMTKIYNNQLSEAQRIDTYDNIDTNGESPDVFVDARQNGISFDNSISVGGIVSFNDYNHGA